MRSFFVCAALCAALVSCKNVRVADSFAAMNTFMSVQVFSADEKKGREVCADVRDEIARLEKSLSVTIPGSDVFRMNNSAVRDVPVCKDVKELVDFSSFMYAKTGGLFNPAIYPLVREWGFTTEQYEVVGKTRIEALLPLTDFSKMRVFSAESGASQFVARLPAGMQVDFGGIAKGYAADKAAGILSSRGIKSALLDLGGNIHALGTKTDGSPWTIAVRCPWNPDDAACAVKVESKAVVTSGGYERFFVGDDGKKYIHIFDPRTGSPAESDVESVTVICGKGMYADCLSTSLFVMGKEGAVDFWRKTRDFDFILITKERGIVYSPGLSGSIKLVFPFQSVSVAG